MTDHDHDHDHDHDGHDHYATPRSSRPRSEFELRTMALEAALTERGLVSTDSIDSFVDHLEHQMGPHHGARAVARAWVDPSFKQRLLADGTAALAELGIAGAEGDNIRVLENTSDIHHLVVCTLCSCYPWPVLGAPPIWYKSFAYRSRAVAEPRAVMREFGLEIDPDVAVKVWDSSAEVRYLVLPERPQGTEDLDEAALAALVTRDSMIGVGLALPAPSA
ncbi:MAG: nitrile hydratase subunit alpha [Ilumatobacteraceae bacterium]|nr:nitrile hydratase subunit alpha [Ilumatobacteraceae bacterium]